MSDDVQLLEKCREAAKSITELIALFMKKTVRERQRERDREWREAFGAEDLMPGDDPLKIAKWVEGSYTHHDEEIKREARLDEANGLFQMYKVSNAVEPSKRREEILEAFRERIRALSGEVKHD